MAFKEKRQILSKAPEKSKKAFKVPADRTSLIFAGANKRGRYFRNPPKTKIRAEEIRQTSIAQKRKKSGLLKMVIVGKRFLVVSQFDL